MFEILGMILIGKMSFSKVCTHPSSIGTHTYKTAGEVPLNTSKTLTNILLSLDGWIDEQSVLLHWYPKYYQFINNGEIAWWHLLSSFLPQLL